MIAAHPFLTAHLGRYPDDNDVRQIARLLDEFLPTPAEMAPRSLLVVGPLDEPLANIIGDLGYDTWGIDLKPYNTGPWVLPECSTPRYHHVESDFLRADITMHGFGAAVSVSTIEHMGLWQLAGPDQRDFYGDVWATRRIHNLLSPGGLCFLTVPAGVSNLDDPTRAGDWRRYSEADLRNRLFGPFAVRRLEYWWTSIRTGQGRATEADVKTYKESADLSAVAVLEK